MPNELFLACHRVRLFVGAVLGLTIRAGERFSNRYGAFVVRRSIDDIDFVISAIRDG